MKKDTENFKMPQEVVAVAETLKKAGFEAYFIGGCVRDLLLEKKPKDWDVTTNAKPEEIIGLFGKTFYENAYGTVGVVNEGTADETLRVVEVTPYRLESTYSDFRRPDSVSFGHSIEDDLKRRDFTINAIALDIKDKAGDGKSYKGHLLDPYGGQSDLDAKILRAVGNPDERLSEDALRSLRAVRIATELGFTIQPETEKSIKTHAALIGKISKERIRDEFIRILMTEHPMDGLIMAQKLGLLTHFVPELEVAIGVDQNQAHKYDVWEHLLRSLQHAADKKWGLDLRLAALFHDIGKPKTRLWSNEKKDWTFHGHDMVGKKIAQKILERLRFPVKTIEKVATLIRWHMFFSDTEVITHSAVRRMLANVGQENIWDLMNLRVCDRIGTGRPKESPYRLRKYKAMLEEVMRDPVSVGMLKIDGKTIIEVTRVTPGPKIGYILHALLEEVLEKPELNTAEYLKKRTLELNEMSDIELKDIGERGKQKKDLEEEKSVQEIRGKYGVK